MLLTYGQMSPAKMLSKPELLLLTIHHSEGPDDLV